MRTHKSYRLRPNSWQAETGLDVQWIHAMAPQAKVSAFALRLSVDTSQIILVCAKSTSSADM